MCHENAPAPLFTGARTAGKACSIAFCYLRYHNIMQTSNEGISVLIVSFGKHAMRVIKPLFVLFVFGITATGHDSIIMASDAAQEEKGFVFSSKNL